MTTDRPLAAEVGERLLARREWLALAESCTGGLIAKLCTDVAGSSHWFERGLVTYSNRAKQELLGVSEALLTAHGAVSEPCAGAMAHGLLKSSPADWAIAVTGVAGPSGGSADKPVGTVWIAWARRTRLASTARSVSERPAMDGRAGGGEGVKGRAMDDTPNPDIVLDVRHQLFTGDREQVRAQSAQVALQVLLEKLHA